MADSSVLPPFRVLALDGGGIRGLYTATLLDILSSSDSGVGKKFNLIAGTSTGGILAIGLAAGIPLKTIISIYTESGLKIFPEKNCLPKTKLKKIHWACKFRAKPASDHHALKKCLTEIFAEATLEDIYNENQVALCIPSVDASTQQAVVIKTPHAGYIKRDGKRKAVDVCLATSAAPLYFPMAALPRTEAQGHDVFVDGGLWANNPVLIGLVEALHLAKEGQPLEIISIGTCAPPEGSTLTPADCHKGTLDWSMGAEALTLSLEAQASGHAFIAEKLAPHLRSPCKVIRLPSSPPPAGDFPHLGLDRAYPKALEVLNSRAVSDAKVIQSMCGKRDANMCLVASILSP